MINAPKGPAGGFGITNFPKLGNIKAPEIGKAVEQLKTAIEGLANNPIMKSLLGQSGFDGVQGKGQAEAATAAAPEAQPSAEEGLKKLIEGLAKFVEQLTKMLGGKAPEAAQGAEGAAGGEAAKGGQGAGGGEAAQGAEGAGAPASAAPAAGAEAAEGAKDPLSTFLEFLTKLVEELQSLMQKMEAMKQQGAQPGTDPSNGTGIVPTGATTAPAAPAPAIQTA
ncbi:MAG: hypothetical protein JXB05_03210 [Myxococcaceae bacterium]|nr:hypothetical protein [Myxococcaceae bacterium]